jgi:hypothetical protein
MVSVLRDKTGIDRTGANSFAGLVNRLTARLPLFSDQSGYPSSIESLQLRSQLSSLGSPSHR